MPFTLLRILSAVDRMFVTLEGAASSVAGCPVSIVICRRFLPSIAPPESSM